MDSKLSSPSKGHRVIQFTNPRSIDNQTYYIDIDSNVDPDLKHPQSYTDRVWQFSNTVGVRVQDYDQEWQQHLFRTFHWISQVNEDITQRQLERCGTLDFYRGKYHSQLTVRPSREDDDMDKFTLIINTEHDEGEDREDQTSRGRPLRRSWDGQGFTQARDSNTDLDHRYHQVITGVQNTDFPDGSHELQISYGHTQDHEPPRHEPSINDLLVQSIRNQSPYWDQAFWKVEKALEYCVSPCPSLHSEGRGQLDICLEDGRSCLISTPLPAVSMPVNADWVVSFYKGGPHSDSISTTKNEK